MCQVYRRWQNTSSRRKKRDTLQARLPRLVLSRFGFLHRSIVIITLIKGLRCILKCACLPCCQIPSNTFSYRRPPSLFSVNIPLAVRYVLSSSPHPSHRKINASMITSVRLFVHFSLRCLPSKSNLDLVLSIGCVTVADLRSPPPSITSTLCALHPFRKKTNSQNSCLVG